MVDHGTKLRLRPWELAESQSIHKRRKSEETDAQDNGSNVVFRVDVDAIGITETTRSSAPCFLFVVVMQANVPSGH